MRIFLLLLISAISLNAVTSRAQVNNICTDTTVEQVLLGQYNPSTYVASVLINTPDTLSRGIHERISADSLKSYIQALATFHTRNSASDTASSSRGIGAARRWVYSKFQEFSAQNQNRLLPAYLQFDTSMCGVLQHRNIFAVLPGIDTSDKSIIIVEAHIDSRCTGLCDVNCEAQGIEDNASGTALVMELARVMSAYSYNHSIVFLITIGEEQGLFGALAFANYCKAHNIPVKAVMNNDVVGGIICGHTASAPGCPGYEAIDSTHVRLFSFGGFNSFHKSLSRYIKLQYKERILPTAHVPMGINIMTPEDRNNRSGDHIPFRQLSYTAMRITSQNEAGDASVSSGTYKDRQHTSADSIGVDVNHDGVIDSYWVDFHYLARNAVINGNAIAMIGISPPSPDFTLATVPGMLVVTITQHPEFLNYKVGVRTTTNDWDTVYQFVGDAIGALEVPPNNYIVSVSAVDASGVESLFSKELMATVTATNGVPVLPSGLPRVELLQNMPNPADEATMIMVRVNDNIAYNDAYISIRDMAGREVSQIKMPLNKGVNEVMYAHGYNMTGNYLYTLIVDGKQVDSKMMVFGR